MLVPELTPGDSLVMDRLGTRKGQAVRRAIEAVGASLLYLPPPASAGGGLDDPDFNPMENALAKLKSLIRKAAERSVGALWDRIGSLHAFTPAECANHLGADRYERINPKPI